MQDDLKERLQLIAELSGRLTSSEVASIAKQAADRIAALEVLEAELTANERMVDVLQFALRDAVETATENARQRDAANHRIEALEVENERLREALRLLHDNVVAAWPSLSELGPVANARAALAGGSHD